MKVSFDGLRRNIAKNFNNLMVELADLSSGEETSLALLKRIEKYSDELRGSIGGLLACYDKDQQPEDFNDLSDVELEEL